MKKNKRMPRTANTLPAPILEQPEEKLNKFLVSQGFNRGDINGVKNGLHPIHRAAQLNNVEILRILLEKGVDVNCVAIIYPTQNIIDKHSIKNKVNIRDNIPQFDCLTPLHMATHGGHIETVQFLLSNNANVNAVTNTGETALMYAAERGHNSILILLLKAGASIEQKNSSGLSALWVAIGSRRIEAVKILGKRACAEDKYRALRMAVLSEKEEMFNQLVKDKDLNVNASPQNESPLLHVAVLNGKYKMAAALLRSKALIDQTDKQGTTLLHTVVTTQDLEAVKFLLKHKAGVNIPAPKNITALHVATEIGNMEIMQLLLENKANVEAQMSPNGYTPLHTASQKGKLEMVHILLEKGANVNAHAAEGETPLHLACQHGKSDPRLIKMILEYSPDIEAQATGSKLTPLHIASIYGTSIIVNMLIHAGANVSARTTGNDTPLSLAIFSREGGLPSFTPPPDENIHIIQSLVESGADLSAISTIPQKQRLNTLLIQYEMLQKFIRNSEWSNIRALNRISLPRQDRADLLKTTLAKYILNLEKSKIEEIFQQIKENFTPVNIFFENGNLYVTFNDAIQAQDFLKVMLLLSNSKQIQQEDTIIRLQYPFSLEATYYTERQKAFKQRIEELKHLLKSSHWQINTLIQEEDDFIEIFFTKDQKNIEVAADSFSIKNDKKGIILRLPTIVLQKPCGKRAQVIVQEIRKTLENEYKKHQEKQNLVAHKTMQAEQEGRAQQEKERRKQEEERDKQAEKEKEIELSRRKEETRKKRIVTTGENTFVDDSSAMHFEEMPLHQAVCRGDIEEIKTSLKSGVDINVKNGEGNTPLHLAAISEQAVVFNFLLKQQSINISLENNEGKTALQIAEEKLLIIDLPPCFQPIAPIEGISKLLEDDSHTIRQGPAPIPALLLYEKDDRDPATASRMLVRQEESIQTKPTDKQTGKKKEKKQKAPSSNRFFSVQLSIAYNGEKGLRDIQDKINFSLIENFYHDIIKFYELTNYVISGLIHLRSIISQANLPFKNKFIRSISIIRNALVHNQTEDAELDFTADFLRSLADFVKHFNLQHITLKPGCDFLAGQISLLKGQKLTDVQPTARSFCEEKITQHIQCLEKIYTKVNEISKKLNKNPFTVLQSYPELQEAAAEIISKVFEYYNRCSKLLPALKGLEMEMKEFRNRQYHETDERALPGGVEFSITPNSSGKVFKLLEKLITLYSQQKTYSNPVSFSQAFFSNSIASHSSSSGSASSTLSTNLS